MMKRIFFQRNFLSKYLLCISLLCGYVYSMNNEHVYFVILAGGNGERLWPLSRSNKPKQLLHIGEHGSLLSQAVDRIIPMAQSKNNILISTTEQHAHAIEKEIGDRVGKIIAEPGLRNTGPAILYDCFQIYLDDPEALIVFLPADPFIPVKDYEKFRQFLVHAIDAAQSNEAIILLGVKPTFPATGYGYIEYDVHATMAPYPVKKFHEKPQLEIAQKYFTAKNMVWNIGIFCAKVSVFLEEFKLHAPQMFQEIHEFLRGTLEYNAIQSNSIDYAVLEKSNRISVLPVDFGWWDVGNIEVLLSIQQQSGILNKNKLISTNSSNNLVDVPDKLVALVGVNDLCIVETDQALLIVKREEAEKVRAIVQLLKTGSFKEYL